MGDPEFRTDEKVLLRTPGVYVKSIPFEGILTTKRIILVDRAKNLLPPKEIPLATIKSVEPGENAIRDQILTLAVLAKTGDTRQMVLTFSRQEGGNRIKERDEWFRQIQGNIGASFENVIRKVIPADTVPRRAESVAAPGPEPQVRREAEGIHPTRKIIDTGVSPAVKEFDASQIGQAIFCSRCGNKVPSDSAFCNRCGSPVVPLAPAPAATASPQPPATAIPVPTLRPIDQEIRSIEPLIEKTHEKIPADPLKNSIPDVAIPKTISWDDDTGEQAAASRQAPSATHGSDEPAAKRGFLPRIFAPKKKIPSEPAPVPVPSFAPPVPEKSRRSLDLSQYRSLFLGIGAIIVILVIVAIGALVVYPMIAGSGQTPVSTVPSTVTPTQVSASTDSGTLKTGKVTVIEIPVKAIPPTGVYVHVYYLGSFKGTYGMKDVLTTVPSNSGDQVWEVENANMTVTAEFEKQDGSAHELVVEIYKDGKVLTKGSTTTGHGYVKLSVDPLTGTATEPVTSGGGSSPAATAATPAPAKAAVNSTTIATTVVMTTGTATTPAANTTTKAP